MSKKFDVETPEATEPVETFENAGDKGRRQWASASGDWAFLGILKFLQGDRRVEVQPAEILTTKIYNASYPREKDSLRFVAEQSETSKVTPADDAVLRERDDFLIAYAEKRMLGHMDWVKELAEVPEAVERAQAVDQGLFRTNFKQPRLWLWIWRR